MALDFYEKKASAGLWIAEKHFIAKYFTKKGKILDVGCGTGRTTIPLVKMGYNVVGVDFAPKMISLAKKIAKKKKLKISYEVGDATKLQFKDKTFDCVFFSNNGWTQIPGREKRLQALQEMKRVCKSQGIVMFTAHPRVFSRQFNFFWMKQWLRFYILKPFGFHIEEIDYGDRFFTREGDGSEAFTRQYIHIPSKREVIKQIGKVGLTLREANGEFQISKDDIRDHPPVFYVCEKQNS